MILRFATAVLIVSTSAVFALDPHVDAVARIVEGAKGKVEKTDDGLSLKLVDLSVPNSGPHDKRSTDPYDAAFFEHLGHITALESLNIISTKFGDEWMPHIARLTNLKTLRFTNNGKLTDAGMVQLAGLKNLETFSFVGTAITGAAYEKFDGFTRLIKVSHRGSSINDEGLRQLCDHLPNLESISLAHAKFTDAGAANLARLHKLKGLEIGTANATSKALSYLSELPLEYLQLGDGLDSAEGIAACQALRSLRRLTLTHCDHLTDDGLKLATDLKQLEQIEIAGLDLPEARLPHLAGFAFLKELKLIRRPQSYPAETQAKIKALLPKVDVKFQ